MIHIILGTKAQLIKMAPVMKVMQDRGIEYNYITTGQHRSTMSGITNNFGIKEPDHTLYHGKDIVSVPAMIFWSVKILFLTFFKRKKIFRKDKKGIVLVHGDTLSTLIGALAAKISGLKVGHVESGLRSFNLFQPFPEEITRILTFYLTDIYFCPNNQALKNLKRFKGRKINTGLNTLYDSLNSALPVINEQKVDIPSEEFCVATLHRFENLKERSVILQIVDDIVEISKSIKVLFILHKPTEKKLRSTGLYQRLYNARNVELRKRYDYFRFIKLIKNAGFIISDGGSNQEECYYMGKPLLLFRNVTERDEGIGHNAVISKFNKKVIKDFAQNYKEFEKPPLKAVDKPSDLIIDELSDFI